MANTDAMFDMFFILLVTAIAVAVKLIIRCISRFNKKTAYIVRMMRCCSDDDYRHWRRELRCHYLCLIPFVTKKNVAKVYHRLYYKPKYMKKKEPRTDGIYHVIAPSLLSICLCAVCLCGVSWAWFTSSQSTGVTQIQSARYDVSVVVHNTTGSAVVTEVAAENDSYKISLTGGKIYTVKITPNGTAKKGYCTVVINGVTYHTPSIEKGTDFSFTVIANEIVTMNVTPQWGSCSDTSNIISADVTLTIGTTQGNNPADQPETDTNTTPAVSDNVDTNNGTDTTTPTAPSEDSTTLPTDTTKQTDPSEPTEDTQPTENKLDEGDKETTANSITE